MNGEHHATSPSVAIPAGDNAQAVYETGRKDLWVLKLVKISKPRTKSGLTVFRFSWRLCKGHVKTNLTRRQIGSCEIGTADAASRPRPFHTLRKGCFEGHNHQTSAQTKSLTFLLLLNVGSIHCPWTEKEHLHFRSNPDTTWNGQARPESTGNIRQGFHARKACFTPPNDWLSSCFVSNDVR